jgi:hypothetical protein
MVAQLWRNCEVKVNKNHLDVSRCFIVFMTLCGDVQKTAAALDIDPAIVEKLATDEQWHQKISRVSLLSKSGKPGEYERGVNRALNFAQSHRARLLLDKVLEEFEDKTPEEILEVLSTRTKSGAMMVSARFFADLIAAMEKAQHMSYLALGDTVAERPDVSTEEGELSANQMHQAVIQALNNPAMRNVSAAKLLNDEQVTHVTQVAERKAPAEAPTESAPQPPGPASVG